MGAQWSRKEPNKKGGNRLRPEDSPRYTYSETIARRRERAESDRLRIEQKAVMTSERKAKMEMDSYMQRERYMLRLGIAKAGQAIVATGTREPAHLELTSDLFDDGKSELSEYDRSSTASTLNALDSDGSMLSTDCSPSEYCKDDSEASWKSVRARSQTSDESDKSDKSEPDFEKSQADYEKSQADDKRMKYLQKLSYSGMWVPKPQRPPSHQTLIIFDWDDTLLCSSFLSSLDGAVISPAAQQQLDDCAAASFKLLELAMSLAHTIIVTNGVTGWVESSAAHWAPSLLPLLRKVHIISARSRYEAIYPQNPMKWKAELFLDVRQQFNSQVITNLISIGDSDYEMEAAQTMAKEFEHAVIKLIKFAPKPSPEELSKQTEVAFGGLKRIVGKARSIHVKLRRSKPL